jgi:hypothetical protein
VELNDSYLCDKEGKCDFQSSLVTEGSNDPMEEMILYSRSTLIFFLFRKNPYDSN